MAPTKVCEYWALWTLLYSVVILNSAIEVGNTYINKHGQFLPNPYRWTLNLELHAVFMCYEVLFHFFFHNYLKMWKPLLVPKVVKMDTRLDNFTDCRQLMVLDCKFCDCHPHTSVLGLITTFDPKCMDFWFSFLIQLKLKSIKNNLLTFSSKTC